MANVFGENDMAQALSAEANAVASRAMLLPATAAAVGSDGMKSDGMLWAEAATSVIAEMKIVKTVFFIIHYCFTTWYVASDSPFFILR